MNSAKFQLLNTKWKEKTTNLILQDLSAKKCETPRHKNHSKTRLRVPLKILPRFLRSGQNFLRPRFFKVPFYTPVIGKNLRVNKWPKFRGNKIKSPVQSRGWRESVVTQLSISQLNCCVVNLHFSLDISCSMTPKDPWPFSHFLQDAV